METNKTLPESLESERIILSNLLCDKEGENFDLCSKLRPHHFLTRSHAIIFNSIRSLAQESKAYDMVSVINHLTNSNKLEEVGGSHFVGMLFSSFITSSYSKEHVDILIEKYRLRKIIDICETVKIYALNNLESNDCLSKLEHEVCDISESDNSNENQLQNACDDLDRMIEVRRKGGEITGLLTGISAFDGIFFGCQKGQYYVLGGIPSSGKTAMADQICGNLLMKDKSVLYISLESSRERALAKIACKLASVSFTDLNRNRVSKEELDTFERIVKGLRKKNLILMRPFDISPMDLRPLIRKCHRRNSIDIVILDYLQKIPIPNGWDERRTASRSSMEIQRACVETGVPAIVVCQLNREIGKCDRPSMRNLKESSQIEQDADNIAFVWSEIDKRELPDGSIYSPCILSVDKNKDGASSLDIPMEFEMKKMIFRKKVMNFKEL